MLVFRLVNLFVIKNIMPHLFRIDWLVYLNKNVTFSTYGYCNCECSF